MTQEREDREALILQRGKHVYVIINLYPYSNGHLMVVPNRQAEERRDLVDTAARCERILETSYRPEGMNVGLNMGAAAGAGVVGHLHVHLVPRWTGDTNFATVVGETRIIPETPDQTYARLGPLFAAGSAATQESS